MHCVFICRSTLKNLLEELLIELKKLLQIGECDLNLINYKILDNNGEY